MAITFKFVTGNEAPGPLGVLAVINPSTGEAEYPDLMVGTNCGTPAAVNVLSNWHFRVENVPEADVFPRTLYGPAPAYGTWYNPSATSQRADYKCNDDFNWPMHVVQSSGANGYTWDIYVAPYLGGSYIAGIEPMLPLQGAQFVLELAQGSEHYMLVLAQLIPPLFPIFGGARDGKSNADFYPALFGWTYKDPDHPDGPTAHAAVDIIPLGLFANGDPGTDWDLAPANAGYKNVYAVVSGTVLLEDVEGQPGLQDVYIATDASSLFPNLQFIHTHIEPAPTLTHFGSVSAGDLIGTILNHTQDTRSDKTHLHFGVRRRVTSDDPVDARQFIYPGLTPDP